MILEHGTDTGSGSRHRLFAEEKSSPGGLARKVREVIDVTN